MFYLGAGRRDRNNLTGFFNCILNTMSVPKGQGLCYLNVKSIYWFNLSQSTNPAICSMVKSFKLALAPSNKVLANFSSQLQQQQQLLLLIKSLLPENLVEHACYCVISNRKILIYTDKAVWASQLRFYNTAICEAVTSRSKYADIEQVQIRILASTSGTTSKLRLPKIPSRETALYIRQGISGKNDDPLSDALNNLCRTLERLSGR